MTEEQTTRTTQTTEGEHPPEAIGEVCPVCEREYKFAITRSDQDIPCRIGPMNAEDVCYINGILIGHGEPIEVPDSPDAKVHHSYLYTGPDTDAAIYIPLEEDNDQ